MPFAGDRSPSIRYLSTYCGHGVVQSGRYFLTGSDAGRTSAQKLPFEEFERLFLQINAQRKILILDSCFSGRAISDHLTEESSILEANVDRLTDEELKRTRSNSFRKGTYVIASAERDKPSPSRDGTGELTAFTSLLTKRLEAGVDHVGDERLAMNTIVDALDGDAGQYDIPRPVRSDKFGLGDWQFIGNAAVLKKKNINSIAAEQIRQEFKLAIVTLEQKLFAQLESLLAQRAREDASDEKKSFFRSFFGPSKTRHGIPIPVWENASFQAKSYLDRENRADERSGAVLLIGVILGIASIALLVGVANTDNMSALKVLRFVFLLTLMLQICGGVLLALISRFGVPLSRDVSPTTYEELNRLSVHDFVRGVLETPSISKYGLDLKKSQCVTGAFIYLVMPALLFLFLSNSPELIRVLGMSRVLLNF